MMKLDPLLAAGLALCAAFPVNAADLCKVESGQRTAALVELYTSEGCSSCPPADIALNGLSRASGAAEVVPLALHVSYWDGIGWKDVFAQKLFDGRQTALLAKAKNRIAYTPQFFINGKEMRQWQDAIPNAVKAVNAKDAAAHISLRQQVTEKNTVLLEASATTVKPNAHSALFLALTESKLVTQVLRGENSGATLRHDHTARLLVGPLALLDGKAALQREIVIPAGWNRQQLQTVAFVQDLDDGSVLQAISTARCNVGQQN
jgi:hypothetical protein